ncbi:MAG: PhzF family phenazine biosynthesis protein [Gammaproteobacteria bacterium]|nr:PhzF family phenazine biosynthesis protein [Gammaproteobacteria bacterium]
MKIRQYQVDAFAGRVFEGNPAAVCPLQHWLEDAVLQAIAGENNLSETAFLVPAGAGFGLRWFTPVTEVDLCGHATLAAAHVIFEHLDYPEQDIAFDTRSGELRVKKNSQGGLSMDFPSAPPVACVAPPLLIAGLGRPPVEVLAADDYLAVFDSAETVRAITPDHAVLSQLDRRGVIISAPSGDEVDFVSRFFAPRYGIPEDPVTGSAHCTLIPYWAGRLGRTTLRARQISRRGGNVGCELRGDRVVLTGTAVTFMEAEITL